MSYRGIFYFRRYVPSKPHTDHFIRFFSQTRCCSLPLQTLASCSWLRTFTRKFCSLRLQNDQRTKFVLRLRLALIKCFWSSPRPISIGQLHALLHFHLRPIYLVVFKGSYRFRVGYLILRGASRLDAFSVYPFPTWLPGHALGSTAGTPAVGPSRSSRTKDSSSQISCAHAG